jgi:regulatory protein
MKITGITHQQKHPQRYSVFIDGAYAFSLSEAALISSKLHHGQELKPQQAGELKLLASGDKLYGQACRYIALRVRSAWEVACYLDRKQAPPALTSELLNKLSNIGLIDDAQYAKVYIHDRQLLRPTSRLKISFELRKKHVSEEIIEAALNANEEIEQTALNDLIRRKRQQSRYQDDLKLMQYLARQGFHYSDIKKALGE